MKAMVLRRPGAGTLEPVLRTLQAPAPGHVLVRVRACGVCRTDLHVVDGDLPHPRVPIVPGHEIVGVVSAAGEGVDTPAVGDRVGIPWLGYSCGVCEYCRSGRENLCPRAQFTGYQIDGGYAEHAVADARYTFKLPEAYTDAEAAPLLCAGLIGHRAYRMATDRGAGTSVRRLGLYGFGAAAHIVAQVASHEGRQVYAFTSPGDVSAQDFARSLGTVWAGASNEHPPDVLEAAIIFAPVGRLVPEALSHIAPGGVVVCAGIHMSDIPSFPYELLWHERSIQSVANLTRRDAREFLALAPTVPVKTHVQLYPLADANRALSDLRDGTIQGAAVLIP
jgi:propanol-preferring alcohol dehydrogenase